MSIDKGYLAATWTSELYRQGKTVIAKPWTSASNGKFGKKAFTMNLEQTQVTCPEGNVTPIRGKKTRQARFPASLCGTCPQKHQCTGSQHGRVVSVHPEEDMLQSLRCYVDTPQGRADARERVKVEHALASICNRKGHRARYIGLRLNEYDLNRTAMICNLHIGLKLAA